MKNGFPEKRPRLSRSVAPDLQSVFCSGLVEGDLLRPVFCVVVALGDVDGWNSYLVGLNCGRHAEIVLPLVLFRFARILDFAPSGFLVLNAFSDYGNHICVGKHGNYLEHSWLAFSEAETYENRTLQNLLGLDDAVLPVTQRYFISHVPSSFLPAFLAISLAMLRRTRRGIIPLSSCGAR